MVRLLRTPPSHLSDDVNTASPRGVFLVRRQFLRLLCAFFFLFLAIMLSLSLGATSIPFTTVMDALSSSCSTAECVIIQQTRLPRTLAGILAGIALGLAGTLMQTLTRNPLADPGILGVNSGASFAIVLGITFFGATDINDYLWFAFSGALFASLLVAVIGALSHNRVTPVRLTLAGVALTAVLEGMSQGIALLHPLVFDQLRFWQAGTLDIQSLSTVRIMMLPILLGALITFSLSRALNNLSMGDEQAAALGTRLIPSQLFGLFAIVLLCGGTTAALGPIAFVGLMMPHIARRIAGPEIGWMLLWTAVLTPILMLSADILGRFLGTNELQVSIVLSLLGAPVLIFLVRQRGMLGRGN